MADLLLLWIIFTDYRFPLQIKDSKGINNATTFRLKLVVFVFVRQMSEINVRIWIFAFK